MPFCFHSELSICVGDHAVDRWHERIDPECEVGHHSFRCRVREAIRASVGRGLLYDQEEFRRWFDGFISPEPDDVFVFDGRRNAVFLVRVLSERVATVITVASSRLKAGGGGRRAVVYEAKTRKAVTA